MATPRDHIEHLRKTWFSIGGPENPLATMLDKAVKYLSDELYTKDVHYFMELIQNAEDNEYPERIDPSLEFVITSRDITATGAPATLLIFNNEKGFSPKNIESICNVGNSTKQGHRKRGYIGEKVLLFLSKIKRLSVREDNEDPRLNTIKAIAITKETNFVTRKNIDAESYTLYLSAEETGDASNEECSYYVWKQKFPVRQENKVDRRMEVEEWVITLAFPNGERLHRGTSSPGVYAFLPTEMVTNFPFIIQADFLLASSRETILLDNIWNEGILDCVPFAFINALNSLVKTTEDAPASSLPPMFKFLPVSSSPYPRLNAVRESIKAKLAEENIVPSESYTEQKFFHKPCEVRRIMPEFWNILKMARNQGVSLHNLSSHGWYVLNSSFDQPEYDEILNFLGVGSVNNEWYAKCIQGSNLIMGVSEETYLEILAFLADNWQSKFRYTEVLNIPIIKYEGKDGGVCLCTINESAKSRLLLCLSDVFGQASRLIDWNREFRCVANLFFMPLSTQEAIRVCSKRRLVWDWFINHVNLKAYNVYQYASVLCKHVSGDRKLAVAYAHFLYSSFSCMYLSQTEVDYLCGIMPLVDNYGTVTKSWRAVLVPANGSTWVQLIGSNPWRTEGYIELGEDYSCPGSYVGQRATGNQLIEFLKAHLGAADIPYISPPNAGIPTVSSPLTKQNAFLLLDWIQNLKYSRSRMPERFLTCIKDGSWLRITMNGCSGYKPPSQSFLLKSNSGNSDWGNIMQNAAVLVDIPLIDQNFYGEKIFSYREELKTVGVMFDYEEACEFVAKRLMSLAASWSLSRSNVISMLNFIKFLSERFLSPEKFIHSVREGRWLQTSCGQRSPVGSVLYDQEWAIAKQLSDIPFIDQQYYGDEILRFKTELQLLGVIVGFNGNYKLVIDYLKSPLWSACLTSEALVLAMDCMRHCGPVDKLVSACKNTNCLKTNLGYKAPGECFLFDPEWGCLLEVFGGFPLIDHSFYGSRINSYKTQLKQLGVKVDFEEAVRVFVLKFKQLGSKFSIQTNNVLSFLSCYRKLKGTYEFPSDLESCIREVQWLKTRLGDYRSPQGCVLYGPEWESIAPITLLPHIDDSVNCYGKAIHEYKEELKSMGVIVKFKDGLELVVSALHFPRNPSTITPSNVFSLLECIQILLQRGDPLPEAFLKKASQKWLKTHAGYRTPDECCLFDSEWDLFVKRTDGPFIDEDFYGSNITSYKRELSAIGVVVDAERACSLLASYLGSHSESTTIVRIYHFLNKYNWKPGTEAASKIWIPCRSKVGIWADPPNCVLHDKDGLFGGPLFVLEKYYEKGLLDFFPKSFGVKYSPSLDDYCQLWKSWERTRSQLTNAECCAFWKCVMKHGSSKIAKALLDDLEKLPVVSCSGEIFLFDKRDVFIADDLQLKDLFEKFSTQPIFVWYPQPSVASLPRSSLFEVYRRTGIRTISESVQMKELSLENGMELKQVNPSGIFIGKELVRLILGFLANPSFDMEAMKRHEAVKCLLNLTVLETEEPINVSYSLSLSSGVPVNVRASQLVRWDRESCKFFTRTIDYAGGQKNLIEYATYFSEAIAEGVLWEHEDHVFALAELIKLAFLLTFDEEAIQFLMKSRNLQIFMEDEVFLSDAFPSV
ncbi:hypothetical protein JCGZ_26396 [Jatropha curcas]|uniref:Uncharacterized protein n=1 Tax=Jatropha curcas TaxID=180498 RepID=A0A067JRE4_JATCU|nr:hypothetical protein JCGZ_26396 [Jatropha curcas]